MKRVVVLSDIQAPLHDKKATAAVQQFVADYEPDELYCVGDEADMTEPARWSKGTWTEYAGNFQQGLDIAKDIMIGFKESLGDKPFHMMRSNHTDRLKQYVGKYAPALSTLRSLDYTELLGYREAGITYHDKIWEFHRGWGLAHGDESGLVRTPGGTALSLARHTGLSIVCGHTHKLGIQHEHRGVNGRPTQQLFGVEVGNLMDLSKASYLKYGGANWQQGFAILYIHPKKGVTPVTVPINNKSFTVEGVQYSW